jgi:hypothetical protein
MIRKPRVKSKQEVAEEIQRKILSYLFERGEPTPLEKICKVTEKSKSETQYYCEVLAKQGWVRGAHISIFKREVSDEDMGVELTPEGRRHMMEDAP